MLMTSPCPGGRDYCNCSPQIIDRGDHLERNVLNLRGRPIILALGGLNFIIPRRAPGGRTTRPPALRAGS